MMRVAPAEFHRSLLAYRQYRYAWWALVLMLVSLAIYAWAPEAQPRNGGTWQGYTLGTVGALLIVWLLWLGIRKRKYATGSGTLQGWVSAHVYLGAALLLVATLHAAFQVGWNLHTLAYGLMVMVILSGFVGLWAYVSLPSQMARNRGNQSRDDLLAQVGEVDRQCLKLARQVHPEVSDTVRSAIARTQVGGGLWRQLSGRDRSAVELPGEGTTSQRLVRNREQRRVVRFLAERLARSPGGQEAIRLQELLWLFARRKTLLRSVRQDIRLQGWLRLWLFVHVPLSLALLIALSAHIFSVFFYW